MKSWIDGSKIFSNDMRLIEERARFRVYCKCGHGTLFFPFEHKDKKVCSWCGYYIYKDKQAEFSDKLKKEFKKVGNNND